MSDLIERLRGKYVIPINDGAGPLDGSMEFIRQFPTPPIHHEAADALESQAKRIAELEPQADAYNFACEDMEKFQRERFEAGKEVGTQGSLCDGMAWVYGRLNELEAEVARLRKLLAPATGKRRKSTQTRSRPEAGARRS